MFDPDKTASMGSAKDPAYDEFATQTIKTENTPQKKPHLVVDETKSKMLLQQIRDNQNLMNGIFGGMVGMTVGAVGWAIITALTHYQIGFMAIGIGFLVGFGIRKMGKGIDPIFGYFGGGLALFGCMIGNLLTTCLIFSHNEGVALSEVLIGLNPSVAGEIMKYTFSPIDLLFYGLAVYYGYRFSFRQLSEMELKSITRPAN